MPLDQLVRLLLARGHLERVDELHLVLLPAAGGLVPGDHVVEGATHLRRLVAAARVEASRPACPRGDVGREARRRRAAAAPGRGPAATPPSGRPAARPGCRWRAAAGSSCRCRARRPPTVRAAANSSSRTARTSAVIRLKARCVTRATVAASLPANPHARAVVSLLPVPTAAAASKPARPALVNAGQQHRPAPAAACSASRPASFDDGEVDREITDHPHTDQVVGDQPLDVGPAAEPTRTPRRPQRTAGRAPRRRPRPRTSTRPATRHAPTAWTNTPSSARPIPTHPVPGHAGTHRNGRRPFRAGPVPRRPRCGAGCRGRGARRTRTPRRRGRGRGHWSGGRACGGRPGGR